MAVAVNAVSGILGVYGLLFCYKFYLMGEPIDATRLGVLAIFFVVLTIINFVSLGLNIRRALRKNRDYDRRFGLIL